MFYLIGTGLKPMHLSVEALEAVKKCSEVFIDSYTSAFSEGTVQALEALAGKKITPLSRGEVEENFRGRIEAAREKNIALLVIGNPLFATTHAQILLEAKKAGIEARAIAGISAFDLVGKSGLSMYRFGGTASIVFPQENYAPESFYDLIAENKKAGMHTLCLLDIQSGRKMSAREAVRILLEIEEKRSENIVRNSVLVAMGKLGSAEERIIAGSAERIAGEEVGLPALLVVCAELGEKEKEFLHEFAG